MTDTERLLAIEEIKSLKARYFRTMDTKDWAGLGTVFAPDSVFDFREATRDPTNPDASLPVTEPVEGGEAIVAAISAALEGINSVHHGHMPEIEIMSATTAKALWPMEDVIRAVDGERDFAFKGYGHYHETYERIDGEWRIKTSKLTRLRVAFE